MVAVVILLYFCPELVTNKNVDIFFLCALQSYLPNNVLNPLESLSFKY